jgi:uncharacterized protein YlxP (DUF503 family)
MDQHLARHVLFAPPSRLGTIVDMVVATCVIKLNVHGVQSLKEKRRILKSILSRLRRQFNLAASEVECQDVWQTAVIGIVSVGSDAAYLHGMMEKAVGWIEDARPDVPIEAYRIEFR